jgi:hypothetical protein
MQQLWALLDAIVSMWSMPRLHTENLWASCEEVASQRGQEPLSMKAVKGIHIVESHYQAVHTEKT